MPQLDVATILLALGGLGLAVSFAVVTGIATARVFFHATSTDEKPR